MKRSTWYLTSRTILWRIICVLIEGGGWEGEAESREGAAGGGFWRKHGAFGGLVPGAERRGGMCPSGRTGPALNAPFSNVISNVEPSQTENCCWVSFGFLLFKIKEMSNLSKIGTSCVTNCIYLIFPRTPQTSGSPVLSNTVFNACIQC